MSSFTEAEKQAIMNLYNKGLCRGDIAFELHMSEYLVNKAIKEMIDSGELISRASLRNTHGNNEEERQKVKELYMQGMNSPEIARILGVSPTTIWRHISLLNKKGEIVKRKAVREKKPPLEKLGEQIPYRKRPTGLGESTLEEGKTVKCNLRIAHTCIYGTSGTAYAGLCNYYLVVGEKRPCPLTECTLYSKITKDNPRRRWMDVDF